MKKIILGMAGLVMAAGVAQAASIVWDTAQTISGDADVSTNGVQVLGVSFTTVSSGRTAVNGEFFNSYNVGQGRGSAENTGGSTLNINSYLSDTFAGQNNNVFGTGSTFDALGTTYQTMLDSAMYNSAASNVITFANLTVGNEYEVQLWANDSRNTATSTGVLELDGTGTFGTGTSVDVNVSNDVSNAISGSYAANGIGQWIMGTFTADAETQTFRLDGYRSNTTGVMESQNGARQLQGVQLRMTSGAMAVVSSSSVSGFYPLEVTFNGINSFSTGTITNYSWSFGDGNTADEAAATNTYSVVGDYTAWLTVMDDLGNTSSNSVSITVEAQPLVAAITATPISGEVPLEVVFDGSASIASDGGTIDEYSWNFGDGNVDSGAIVTNTYMTTGVYTSALVVADSNGMSATNTVTINVNPVSLLEITTQVAGTVKTVPFPADFTPISTNDLGNAGQATLSSVVVSAGVTGNANAVNDGISGSSANSADAALIESEDAITFNFDTTVNTLGYDISNINTYAAWNPASGGRANQGYDVTVTYMDDRTELVSSGTYEPNATPNTWTAVYMTHSEGVIASGVKAITFDNFDAPPAGGVVAYREFDVLGKPSTVQEIGDVTMGTISGNQVVLTWNNGIICDVWTNANLVYPSWGVAETGVSSPVTNAIGSEATLFYELRK